MDKYLPIAMVVMSFLSLIIYAFSKDYAKAVYWLSAAFLTCSTIFM